MLWLGDAMRLLKPCNGGGIPFTNCHSPLLCGLTTTLGSAVWSDRQWCIHTRFPGTLLSLFKHLQLLWPTWCEQAGTPFAPDVLQRSCATPTSHCPFSVLLCQIYQLLQLYGKTYYFTFYVFCLPPCVSTLCVIL